MEVVAKRSCIVVAELLHKYGIEDVVFCPGSRNAPLLLAIERKGTFATHLVIDERSATFVALGLSMSSGKPVAVVCTSGSAVLDMAPALAEAYYRRIPVIAITADRPLQWIDQDDSQTIRQAGALKSVVRYSVDIPCDDGSEEQLWYINRLLNDAFSAASYAANIPGPVHINVQLSAPLTTMAEKVEDVITKPSAIRKINRICPKITAEDCLNNETVRRIYGQMYSSDMAVVVIGGLDQYGDNQSLKESIGYISRNSNIIFMAEAQSGLQSSDGVYPLGVFDVCIGLCGVEKTGQFRPKILVTFGGSLVSANVKKFMRVQYPEQHIRIGFDDNNIDTFKCLTDRLEIAPETFFEGLCRFISELSNVNQAAGYMPQVNPLVVHTYREFKSMLQSQIRRIKSSSETAEWSDLQALYDLFGFVPSAIFPDVHFSNGTAIRYAQVLDMSRFGRVFCNRGVSGIDGSTSTAIGSAIAAARMGKPTLFVTGDMSAQYDLSAIALDEIPPTFRMVVLSNGGGNIFRVVKTTAQLPERERLFAAEQSINLPLENLAEAYGFDYYEASTRLGIEDISSDFFNLTTGRPAILEIFTDSRISADVMISLKEIK